MKWFRTRFPKNSARNWRAEETGSTKFKAYGVPKDGQGKI
jgi:hypothetical protein